jgi:hypothetical protein
MQNDKPRRPEVTAYGHLVERSDGQKREKATLVKFFLLGSLSTTLNCIRLMPELFFSLIN